MQLGMIGLGRMGGNMAKRIAAAGHEVVGYDHSPESDRTVASLKELVAALKAPRLVWVMVPLAAGMSPTHLALLVLAIGAGSVFFSHLNDAGFWLVKEYFGMSVGQTLKTWSLMETILSVVALACVMLLSLVL